MLINSIVYENGQRDRTAGAGRHQRTPAPARQLRLGRAEGCDR